MIFVKLFFPKTTGDEYSGTSTTGSVALAGCFADSLPIVSFETSAMPLLVKILAALDISPRRICFKAACTCLS